MKLQHRMFAIIMAFMLPVAAHAVPIPVTYVIAGPAYTSTGTHVPAGVTQSTTTVVVEELGANFSGTATLLDYMFFDGFSTISPLDTDFAIFDSRFTTDAAGDLLTALLEVQYTQYFYQMGGFPAGVSYRMVTQVFTLAPQRNFASTSYCVRPSTPPGPGCDPGQSAYNLGDVFHVTVASVPEPAMLALLSLGILGAVLHRHREGAFSRRS